MKRRFIIGTATLLSILLLVGCGQAETTGNADTSIAEVSADATATQEPSEAPTPELTAEPTPAATQEVTPKPTAEPTPVPSEEVAPEPTTEPTPVPTEESTPEPQITYTYTDMSVTMYAIQTVNVRNLPSTDGEKVGSLSTNQEVTVTGQCNETAWYRFDYNGQTAFVSNDYLSTEMIEVAAPAPEASEPASNGEPFPYELHVMYYDNMGYPYYYYIGLNALYISPEDEAKNLACQNALSNYVFENFQNPVYDPVTNITTTCSFDPNWGPVGTYQSDGKPIYVQYVYKCNGVVLPSPEERGIFTAGLGW